MAGNRETIVDGTGTTTYAYNAGNRLTLITDPDSTVTTDTGELSLQNGPKTHRESLARDEMTRPDP